MMKSVIFRVLRIETINRNEYSVQLKNKRFARNRNSPAAIKSSRLPWGHVFRKQFTTRARSWYI